jgi:hypothetical protein
MTMGVEYGEVTVLYAYVQQSWFSGAFAKFRKATTSSDMSVRLSAWKKLGSQWTDFHEI